MDAKPPFNLEDIRAEARRLADSKIAALKEQYPQAPDCAVEAAAKAELIAAQSILLLRMRDLLLPVVGSLDGGDLSRDSSYLLAGAIVLWKEFSKDAFARAEECVKLIPTGTTPSGDRTIKGHTEKSATLSVLHFCHCLFTLALLLDRKARAPDIPDPDEQLGLLLADGYSPQAAAEFIEKEMPADSVMKEFQRTREAAELELAAIHGAAATSAAFSAAVSAAVLAALSNVARTPAPGSAASPGSAAASAAPSPGPEKVRIWNKDCCPECRKPGIEWVSCIEFERRTKEDGQPVKRETLSKYIEAGTYWSDERGRLPWCPTCKGRTPKGKGEAEPEVSSATEQQARMYADWCATLAAKELHQSRPPSLEAPVARREGRYTDIARDAALNATAVVLAEHRAHGRELTRDEVDAIAKPVIKSFVKGQTDFEASALGTSEDVEHAVAASKNPRPKGQRKAPHKGEGRSYHFGD